MANKLSTLSRMGHVMMGLGKGATSIAKFSAVSYAGWSVLVDKKGIDETLIGLIMGNKTMENYHRNGVSAVWERLALGEEGAAMAEEERVARAAAQAAAPVTPTPAPLQGQPQGVEQPGYSAVQSGGLGSITSVINQFLGGLSGGRLGLMNTVSLIAGAYLLFGGKFGWLGKIAGLFLGGSGLMSLLNAPQTVNRQHLSGYEPLLEEVAPEEEKEENVVVTRGR